jgi:hypothetical protein
MELAFYRMDVSTTEYAVAQDIISRILDWLLSRLPSPQPAPVPVRVRVKR